MIGIKKLHEELKRLGYTRIVAGRNNGYYEDSNGNIAISYLTLEQDIYKFWENEDKGLRSEYKADELIAIEKHKDGMLIKTKSEDIVIERA